MELKNGYRQTEVGIIPEDWEVGALGDACIKIQDGNYGGLYPKSSEFVAFGVPFLTSKVIGKDGVVKEKLIDFITINKHSILAKAHLALNDVLFTNRGASVGTIGFVDKRISNGNIGPQLTLLRANKDLLESLFLYQAMKSNLVQKQILGQDSGSAMNFFGIGSTKKFKIPIPPPQEQTAIATALSDADALISRLEVLIAKKLAIKQGAMQQLLKPKEGWEVKKLGSCLLKAPNYGINAPSVPYSDILPAYIRITDISEDGRFMPENRTSVDHELSSNYLLEKGDLVFARTGASVGKSYLYNEADGSLVFAGFLIRIKTNPEVLNPVYLQNFITTKPYWDWVKVMSMRSGQPGINSNEFKQLEIPVPLTLTEQTRIAQTLSDMDHEIAGLEQKLAKYKLVKLGMMQELLTGKTRLV